jgi:hypothetical protein
LQGENGPEYWFTFQNFYVITRYNRSPLYAMAVNQLAQGDRAGVNQSGDAPHDEDARRAVVAACDRAGAGRLRRSPQHPRPSSRSFVYRRRHRVGSGGECIGSSGGLTTTPANRKAAAIATTSDSVPDGPPPDISNLPEPVPKVEPRSLYGNKSPYTVLGRTYRVLPSARGYDERGIASFYGNKFHGYKTSSLENYDMYKFTAASKTLPLPSYARVTNLQNGKSVIVRINDRGPFHEDRVIDLSYVAAVKDRRLAQGHRPGGSARHRSGRPGAIGTTAAARGRRHPSTRRASICRWARFPIRPMPSMWRSDCARRISLRCRSWMRNQRRTARPPRASRAAGRRGQRRPGHRPDRTHGSASPAGRGRLSGFFPM